MTDNILDYRFDRSRSAKDEITDLLKRPDAGSIMHSVLVESRVMGLDGQTYIKYDRVKLNELAKRSYYIHWGHDHPSILYTDVAHLPEDVRVHSIESRNLPLKRLSAMEQAMMASHFKSYYDQNRKHWGTVDVVKPK